MTHLNKPQIVIPDVKPEIHNGGGGWPLKLNQTEHWAWGKEGFNDDEINEIISLGTSSKLVDGPIASGVDYDTRKSQVSFLYPNQYTSWLFKRMSALINGINQDYFQFDLYGIDQGLQFTSYSGEKSHYDWHVDASKGNGNRKLSVSVQLSDPKDYKGGNLELFYGGKPVKIPRDKGMAVFFPSYVVHRVTPVTKGTRYSLVCWVAGPPFK